MKNKQEIEAELERVTQAIKIQKEMERSMSQREYIEDGDRINDLINKLEGWKEGLKWVLIQYNER